MTVHDWSDYIEVTSLSDNYRSFINRYTGKFVYESKEPEDLLTSSSSITLPNNTIKVTLRVRCNYCGQNNNLNSLCCEFCGGRL